MSQDYRDRPSPAPSPPPSHFSCASPVSPVAVPRRDIRRQTTQSFRRTSTLTCEEDYTIIDGINLRFADEDVERSYRRVRSQNSQGILLSMWIVFFAMSAVYLLACTFMEPWDYSDLPASAACVVIARAIYIVIVQAPLFLWMFGSRLSPECIEIALYVISFLGLLMAAGPMNFWRAGVVMDGNGHYLFEHSSSKGVEQMAPNETMFVSCFFCMPIFYSKVPLIRASRAWIHLLVTYVLFAVLMLFPGLSPEGFATILVVVVIMGFYYQNMVTSLLKAERFERTSWARQRQLEEEARHLYEAEESRRMGMIRSVSEDHERELLKALARAVESEESSAILAAKRSLVGSRWTLPALDKKELEIRKQQSEERGVTLSYLLSDEFEELARNASDLEDPSFHDLVEPFFLGRDAIGRDKICPRDGRQGCALVDSLPVRYRKRCTHFLSWTWSSKVSTVREALQRWVDRNGGEPEEVAFFMCFFVNNQYRILVPGADSRGSDTLGDTFEKNLLRTRRMVALLDTFDKPTYLTRIWTIFEQFTAMRLGVEVEVTLPQQSRDALIAEFEKGREGIMRVRDAMSTVDASRARASDPADELKVKKKIVDSVGFKEVDAAIKRVMCEWVGAELRAHMDDIMHDGYSRATDIRSDSWPGANQFDFYEVPTLLSNLFSRSRSPLVGPDHKGQAMEVAFDIEEDSLSDVAL